MKLLSTELRDHGKINLSPAGLVGVLLRTEVNLVISQPYIYGPYKTADS